MPDGGSSPWSCCSRWSRPRGVRGVRLARVHDRGRAEKPEVTVTAAPPTPTIDPVERTADTEFAKVLPASVRQFALRSEAPTEAFEDAGRSRRTS
ncbi:hypothetical protein NKG05_06595 [Oerskovia sp. M15]